jgi:hypothetical protein
MAVAFGSNFVGMWLEQVRMMILSLIRQTQFMDIDQTIADEFENETI